MPITTAAFRCLSTKQTWILCFKNDCNEHLIILADLWLVVLLRLNLLLDVSKDLVLPPSLFGGLLDEGALAFLTSLEY